MNAVNAVILERMQSKVALIPELAGHLIAGGGKRMRPMLTLACGALLGYPGSRHHKLAAAREFIHPAPPAPPAPTPPPPPPPPSGRGGGGTGGENQPATLIGANPASVLVGDFL